MYFIVANPNSDRGRTMFYLPVFTALFDKAGIPYEMHITKDSMDGYNETLKFCQRQPGLKGVIGIGGDGVVQEIAAGMADAFITPDNNKIPIPLGILPSVTGNDFISTLEGDKHLAKMKYGKNKNIEEVCQCLFDAVVSDRFQTIDILTANGMAFLLNGYVGVDAEVARSELKSKERLNDKTYVTAAFKAISKYKNLNLTIDVVNGNEHTSNTGEYAIVVVANGQYYGSGMRICPDAKLDDGKITLCRLHGRSRLRMLLTFLLILMEKHVNLKTISFVECDSVKITLPPERDFMCLDGNIYPCKEEIQFKILPRAMKIFR